MFENIDRRKLILLAAIILAVVILGWLLYLVWNPQPEVKPQPNVNEGGVVVLPNINKGNFNFGGGINIQFPVNGNENVNTEVPTGPKPAEVAAGGETIAPTLTTSSTLQPTATKDGQVNYYDSRDGKFYEISPDGKKTALSDATYPGVEKLTWSPSKSSAILEFPDSAKILYDFRTQKQYTLPKEMTEFSFAPDGSKIAGKFMGEQPADRWITTINPDGSGLTAIEPMGSNADKVNVEWAPNNQVVALSRTGEPSGLFQQQVLLIGFHGENFRALTIDGRGFEPQWTPDGNRLLYSVYSDKNNYRPSLWLVDGATDRVGNNKQDLNLATWADKCTFAGTTAYCAVPTELPDGSGFVRELAQGVPDNIWKVDLTSGSSTLVAQPVDQNGNNISATTLTASTDGKYLYFTDEHGRLHNIQLQP